MISLHETCQQYVIRRLSEGWKIVKQEGFNVILQSPDGIIRPVDLRNDVETLRPNAPGSEESLSYATSGAGKHWQDVDDVVPDESGSEVRGDTASYLRDLYNLPASIHSGTIHNIKIYFRVIHHPTHTNYAKPSLKSNSTVTDGTEIVLTPYAWAWVTHSQTWTTNPADGQPWEWTDIDALQIGVSLKTTPPASSYCTQVYVEVDYTSNPSFIEEQTTHDMDLALYTGRHSGGQRLTISNRQVTKLGFWLWRDADPYSGDVTFMIRRVSDDSIICSKVWGDRTELPTSVEYVEVEFDTPQIIDEEVRILARTLVGETDHNIWQRVSWNADVKANEYLSYGDAGAWTDREDKDAAYRYTWEEPPEVVVGSKTANMAAKMVAAGLL